MHARMIKRLHAFVIQALTRRGARYFLAGGWNTFFGYACSLVIWNSLHEQIGVFGVGIASNVIAISMAFIVYKVFVFRTHGNWWREYLRSYVVYGGSAVFGIFMLWFLVSMADLPFWQAQGLTIMVTVVISYFGHAIFTFSGSNE